MSSGSAMGRQKSGPSPPLLDPFFFLGILTTARSRTLPVTLWGSETDGDSPWDQRASRGDGGTVKSTIQAGNPGSAPTGAGPADPGPTPAHAT